MAFRGRVLTLDKDNKPISSEEVKKREEFQELIGKIYCKGTPTEKIMRKARQELREELERKVKELQENEHRNSK